MATLTDIQKLLTASGLNLSPDAYSAAIANPDITYLQLQSNQVTSGNYKRVGESPAEREQSWWKGAGIYDLNNQQVASLTPGSMVTEVPAERQAIEAAKMSSPDFAGATFISPEQQAQNALNAIAPASTPAPASASTPVLGSADYTNLLLKQASALTGIPAQTFTGQANQAAPITAPAPLNIPGQSTQAPAGEDLTKKIKALQDAGLTPQQIQQIISGAPSTAPANPITSPASLANKVTMDEYLKKLTDNIANLSAGLPVGGQEKVLTDLFTKYGIQKEFDALDAYNQIIIDSKKKLKELPDAIKNSLAGVGVTADQLTRLQNKETKPILDALNETMAQAGAAQDRVNQSLKLVGMFADASQADQAAKLEIAKFQIQEGLSIYKDMKQDQKDALDRALTEKTNIMKLGADLLSNGVSPDIVNAVMGSQSYEDAVRLAAPSYQQIAQNKTRQDAYMKLATDLTGDPIKDANLLREYSALFGIDVNVLLKQLQTSPSIKGTKGQFTTTQTNTGAAKAGISVNDFIGLNSDVQNFFINTSATAIKGITSQINDISTGVISVDEVKANINSSNLSQPVKDYFLKKVDAIAVPYSGTFANPFSSGSLSGFLNDAWQGLTDLFGQ